MVAKSTSTFDLVRSACVTFTSDRRARSAWAARIFASAAVTFVCDVATVAFADRSVSSDAFVPLLSSTS